MLQNVWICTYSNDFDIALPVSIPVPMAAAIMKQMPVVIFSSGFFDMAPKHIKAIPSKSK